MALTKTVTTTLFTSGSVTAGLTKGTAATGTAKDMTACYGGVATWSITNGGSAPGVAPTVLFQISGDNSTWRDYYMVGGDTTASSVNLGSVPIDLGVMYLRVLAYGHTTNAVTVAAEIEAVTAV